MRRTTCVRAFFFSARVRPVRAFFLATDTVPPSVLWCGLQCLLALRWSHQCDCSHEESSRRAERCGTRSSWSVDAGSWQRAPVAEMQIHQLFEHWVQLVRSRKMWPAAAHSFARHKKCFELLLHSAVVQSAITSFSLCQHSTLPHVQ
jgi:hypothetical protein